MSSIHGSDFYDDMTSTSNYMVIILTLIKLPQCVTATAAAHVGQGTIALILMLFRWKQAAGQNYTKYATVAVY